MISQSTLENLRSMHCSAMATALQQQLADPKTYGQLGFEKRFSLIVDAEWNRRQVNKLKNLSVIPLFRKVLRPLKPLSSFLTGSWTNRRFYGQLSEVCTDN